MQVEKRSSRRRAFNAKVKGHNQLLQVFDVSDSGVRLVGCFKPTNESLELTLELNGRTTECRGQVAWCKAMGPSGIYQVGVRFTETEGELDLTEAENRNSLGSEYRGALRNLSDSELDHLRLLTRISGILNQSSNIEELMRSAMEITLQILDAERGMLLTGDAEEYWTPLVVLGSGGERFSSLVTGHVLRTGQPLISVDVAEDTRLKASSSLKMLGTRSVLCVPIKTVDRLLGLMYLDNSMEAGSFREPELHIATVVADMVATALERAEYLGVLTESRQQLACALEDIQNLVERNPDAMLVVDGQNRVLFCNESAREFLGKDPQGEISPVPLDSSSFQSHPVRTEATEWDGEPAHMVLVRK